MTSVPGWERWAAATGIGFVLSSAIAFLIVPDPPTADEGSEFILNFVAVNDSDLLWQAFFFGLGGSSCSGSAVRWPRPCAGSAAIRTTGCRPSSPPRRERRSRCSSSE
jgi:hypothetical protein